MHTHTRTPRVWQLLYCVLVTMHLADLLLLTVVGRPFRMLRGGLVLLRFRSLCRITSAVLALCANRHRAPPLPYRPRHRAPSAAQTATLRPLCSTERGPVAPRP